MIATTQQIFNSRHTLADLPNLIGRKFIARAPFLTTIREGGMWWPGQQVDAGALLEFAGWIGLDRSERFASFVTPDKPGCVVVIPLGKLAKWCDEVSAKQVAELAGIVKVRIVDDCDCGEGR